LRGSYIYLLTIVVDACAPAFTC